jgi:hypothetical protein
LTSVANNLSGWAKAGFVSVNSWGVKGSVNLSRGYPKDGLSRTWVSALGVACATRPRMRKRDRKMVATPSRENFGFKKMSR